MNLFAPATARWTAPDPLGEKGGDEDWYGYCLDDPVNLVDPLGLEGFGVSGYGYYDADWGGNRSKGKSKGDQETKKKEASNTGGSSPNTAQQNRDMEARVTREKTLQNITSEMDQLADEEAKKDRIAAREEEKDRQRRALSGYSIGLHSLAGAAVGAFYGASAGPIGMGIGAFAGATGGLLGGTLNESIEQSHLSPYSKRALQTAIGLWMR